VADLRDYALGAARRNGVPMDLFERQIAQESGFNPKAFNAGSGATGIAQIIPRWHPGVDASNPTASLDYAAQWMADLYRLYGSWRKALAAYNWGPGNVAEWDGRRETLPEETRHYLDVILGDGWPEPKVTPNVPNVTPVVTPATNRVAYNPGAPVDPQPDDWSCSVQSAQWLLRSIGRNPSRVWLEQQLVGPLSSAPVVSREYGLMDASGRTLAAWLQRVYGDEMDVTFEARPVNSWEDLVALAGKGPMMLGGRAWGHWSGIRAYRDGKVLLANPAGSWKGVGQELTRDEFDALGSWSAITTTLPAPGVGDGPSSSNDEDTILGLRRAVAHLADVVVPKAAAAAAEREAALAEAARIRLEFVGAKP